MDFEVQCPLPATSDTQTLAHTSTVPGADRRGRQVAHPHDPQYQRTVPGGRENTLDAVALSWLRLHYGTLWAAVLGHGFNNTIGLVTFFLVGPVGALW